jgi:hypothetical protein
MTELLPIRNRPKPIGCPIAIALWQEYREHNPEGLKHPPSSDEERADPELKAYCDHVAACTDCNAPSL